MTTKTTNGPIQGPVVAQYFGFFDGIPKAQYNQIVATAPFDKCNLLILAFVHAVEKNGVYLATLTNGRDKGVFAPGDADSDRISLVVETARAKNPDIKILMSLGYDGNELGNAASTPKEFAESVRELAQKFALNGFDIDYEPPNEAEATSLVTLRQEIRAALQNLDPPREVILTITPALVGDLTKDVLEAFDYTMPQTYHHNSMRPHASWFADLLGSYSQIVYGLSSEPPSDPAEYFATKAKERKAAGIFAWRLDNDSTDESGFPTFATGVKMWQLMHSTEDEATSTTMPN